MSFPERFELLELLRDGEVQMFRARERATGRALEAHFASSLDLLSGVGTGLDRGSHEGKFYVVASARAETAPLDSAGAWRVTPSAPPPSDAPPSAAPPPPQQPARPQSGAAPGDFTRMFQLRQAPEPVALPASKPPSAPASTSQPGEFTRAFQKPTVAPSAAPVGSPGPGQPGEFTRMFQKPVPPAPPAAPPVSSPLSETPENPVPALPAPVSQPRWVFIVIAIVVLSAIAVFVWARRLY